MSPLTDALVRLRCVADEHDRRAGAPSAFSADVTLVARAVVWSADRNAEMRDLLKEYAQRGADIAEPSARSLIARTRELLARVEG